MVKYCVYCGQAADDQALYCTSCGKAFPAPSAPAAAPTQNQSAVYTSQVEGGAHKHILTDVYLRDSTGKTVLVAKRDSMLHQNYTMVDGSETTAGYIEEKTHLTHRSFTVQDANHVPIGSVNISNLQSGRGSPRSWLEDPSGNRLADVVLTMGVGSFSVTKVDGLTVFQATATLGGGIRQDLEALSRRSYSIQVGDPSFPLPLVLAVLTALEQT